MIFKIPEIPKSLNRFAGRQNVWEYRAEKNRWKELCEVFCRPKPQEPLSGVTVKLTFVFPDNRRRDLDNLIKPVLDGLTAAGIIEDDSYQTIRLELAGRYEKGKRKTIIETKGI